MIDRYVVGGFYRVHTGRGKDENLNAPGMHFEPLAFDTGCTLPDYARQPGFAAQPLLCLRCRRPPGLLAAALELERTAPEADGE